MFKPKVDELNIIYELRDRYITSPANPIATASLKSKGTAIMITIAESYPGTIKLLHSLHEMVYTYKMTPTNLYTLF